MIDPCFSHWQTVRWENAASHRYYEARLLENLCEEWEVFCVWGGLGSRLGGSRVVPVSSYDAALALLATIQAKRQQRRYLRVRG